MDDILFELVGVEMPEDEYKAADLSYDIESAIMGSGWFKDTEFRKKIQEQFELIETSYDSDYVRIVYRHIPSNRFVMFLGDQDSWKDDDSLGESRAVEEVFPTQITITRYLTAVEKENLK